MKKLALTLFVAFSVLANVWAQKAGPDMIVGNWRPSDGRSVISIYKGVKANGEDPSKYYGKVVWLIEPNDDKGNPRLDVNNPEDNLKGRALKGLVNIQNLEFTGSKNEMIWENGTAYDPKNGSTYDFMIEIDKKKPDLLDARGYIGVSLFGRSDTWKRLVKK